MVVVMIFSLTLALEKYYLLYFQPLLHSSLSLSKSLMGLKKGTPMPIVCEEMVAFRNFDTITLANQGIDAVGLMCR